MEYMIVKALFIAYCIYAGYILDGLIPDGDRKRRTN